MKELLVAVLALALAAAGGAHPYTNHAFSYAVDLPAGWAATADANPAEFTGPGGIAAKIRVIPRPQALSAALVAKLARSDEEKVGAKFPRSRAFNVTSVPLGALETRHYAFVYIDAKASPRVLRFALASRAAAAGHLWLKVQFAYPRLAHAQAGPAIDRFLAAFRWVEAPAPGAMPAVPGLPDPAGADVAGALAPEPPSGPAGEQPDADSAYYLSLNQKMSEKDTQAHIETFRGGAEHRTEEEMARARSYGMGDILKPNE